MRLATVTTSGRPTLALIEEDGAHLFHHPRGMLGLLEAGAATVDFERIRAEDPLPLDAVELQAPLVPRQIIAVGANYLAHVGEANEKLPTVPLTFAKLPSSVIGPGAFIELPLEITKEVDFEAELAIVIGNDTSPKPHEKVFDVVFGYTCANDVSARDLQRLDGQWMRAKSLPTFTPLGPWITTADEISEPQELRVRGILNETVMQDAPTSLMIFDIRAILSFATRNFVLMPGDVILTGTPAGVGAFRTPPRFLSSGDVFTVEIPRVGLLSNPCRDA